MDTDFTIRAANTAYLTATHRSADELINVHMFDAFPDNPEDAEADGVANLTRSLERAAHTRRRHNMWVQRYDIPDVAEGGFLRRYWRPVNIPILDDGRVVGIAHQVEDITSLQEDLRRVIEQYRDIPADGSMSEAQARSFAESASVVATSAAWVQGLAEEVMGLRRALTSRATIDQAKGIIMAERRCDPDQAFAVLTKLSQDTNVRVADVAAALVYKAGGASRSTNQR